jgi:predicted nucleic acid-binding protein
MTTTSATGTSWRPTGPLLRPSTVFTEVCRLLERRRGMQAELAFLADVRAGRFRLVDDLEPDLDRIAALVERYADLSLGKVDASVVALTERLELREVATLDRWDFSVVRPGTRPPSPCSRSGHEPAIAAGRRGRPGEGTGGVLQKYRRTTSGRRVGAWRTSASAITHAAARRAETCPADPVRQHCSLCPGAAHSGTGPSTHGA